MIQRIRKFFIRVILYISSLFLSASSLAPNSIAGETEVLQYLSCEGGFAADILNYGSPYSCIREPLLDQIVTALLTVGMSIGMTTRLKMHNDHLYPDNCTRENRADYDNPTITFGFCNNLRLIAMNIWGALQVIGTGDISDAIPDPRDYVFDFIDTEPGYYNVYADTSLIRIPPRSVSQVINTLSPPVIGFTYNVDVIQDRICVNILTAVGAYMPVGCKYIKEPFPRSLYEHYGADEQNVTSGNNIEQCSSIYSCSQRAKLYSYTLAPILSPIITCIREMILRLIVSTEVCNPTKIDQNTEENLGKAFAQGLSSGSMLHKFQTGMQRTVTALLTLYVMFFGFKILMGGGKLKQSDVINFIIKFLLVSYFSIGINMQSGGATMRFDGMSQFVFPFMLNGVTELASWLLVSGSTNGLCDFSRVVYNSAADFNMSLWDQIDCRLAYYIGYDGLLELVGKGGDDPVKHHIPPYVFLMIPGIILANMDLIMMALMYPIMIVSFVAYTVCMFVSALILILLLGILAPIFVPCALFSQTTQYFEKWWKNLFALMLQPAIAVAFLSIMFTVYDRGFYGTCQYRPVNITYRDDANNTKTYLSFYISESGDDYHSQEEFNLCQGSMGYFFNNPTATLFGGGSDSAAVSASNPDIVTASNQQDTDVLNGEKGKPKLEWKDGLLSQSPKMIWQELIGIIKNFIVCFILLTVLKNLMEIINDFITNLSGGEISSGSMIGTTTMQSAANKAISTAAAKMESLKKGKEGTPESRASDSKDPKSASAEGSSESSAEGAEASDGGGK